MVQLPCRPRGLPSAGATPLIAVAPGELAIRIRAACASPAPEKGVASSPKNLLGADRPAPPHAQDSGSSGNGLRGSAFDLATNSRKRGFDASSSLIRSS